MKIAIDPIINPLLGDRDYNGVNFFSNAVATIVSLLFIGGVIVFVLILLISAINWITSGGDKAKASAAREKMFNAFIGLLILFSVYAIIRIVGTIFDIDLLSINADDLNIL